MATQWPHTCACAPRSAHLLPSSATHIAGCGPPPCCQTFSNSFPWLTHARTHACRAWTSSCSTRTPRRSRRCRVSLVAAVCVWVCGCVCVCGWWGGGVGGGGGGAAFGAADVCPTSWRLRHSPQTPLLSAGELSRLCSQLSRCPFFPSLPSTLRPAECQSEGAQGHGKRRTLHQLCLNNLPPLSTSCFLPCSVPQQLAGRPGPRGAQEAGRGAVARAGGAGGCPDGGARCHAMRGGVLPPLRKLSAMTAHGWLP